MLELKALVIATLECQLLCAVGPIPQSSKQSVEKVAANIFVYTDREFSLKADLSSEKTYKTPGEANENGDGAKTEGDEGVGSVNLDWNECERPRGTWHGQNFDLTEREKVPRYKQCINNNVFHSVFFLKGRDSPGIFIKKEQKRLIGVEKGKIRKQEEVTYFGLPINFKTLFPFIFTASTLYIIYFYLRLLWVNPFE